MKKLSTVFLRFIHGSDILLIALCTLCSTYGVLLVYSSGAASGFSNQLIASVGGLFVALAISQVDYRAICRLWPVFAVPTLVLVSLTFTSLGYNVAGTDDTAWLGLPLGSDSPFITFQPSELLKIVFIITFSLHLEKVKDLISRFSTVMLLCVHAAVPTLLVFLQGDDGTALVFLCIFAVMMFTAGVHWGYFAAVAGAAVPGAFLMWQVLDEQKRGRIMALIHPEQYLETYGWQQNHALISMGNGGLWGTGYLKGGAVSLYARNNDFIFTEAAEEFGLMGSLFLLLLLLGVIFALLRAAFRARDELGRSLCIGMMGLIAFQSIINLGMNLRLLPVIGITLPFFSAGGSSVLTLYLGIGLILSVSFRSKINNKNSIFTRFR